MATTEERSIVVFGGTGFLGRRVVWHLRKAGFSVRIASRHPDRSHRQLGFTDPQLCSVEANIHDQGSITSQLPVTSWHEIFGDPTYADAILDRHVHNAHRIERAGESLR